MADRPDTPGHPAAPLPAEQILESITDGFLAVGPDWRITYVNTAAARLYPEDRRWYVGKVFWDVFPAVDDTVFGPAYRRAMRDRVPVQVEGHYGAFDRWFDVNIYPTPDGGVAFYFRDVTDRMRAADELVRVTAASDQRRRLYETILSNTPDLAYVFDL